MSSRLKKLTCLAGSFILLAGLTAGCGGGEKASKDVKIGLVYELTGNTASYGTSAINGAKLAFKQINANGGVLGKQIQLVTADRIGRQQGRTVRIGQRHDKIDHAG